MNRIARLLVVVVVMVYTASVLAQSGITYVYDELGRLIAVIDPNGDTAVYSYDAVGNVLNISRHSSSQLSVINFSPSSGPVGSTVTVNGTAFSTTPAQNTVQFNGTGANVNSASATQLTVTVPAGATTGPISVTTAAGTVTTVASCTVTAGNGPPTITGFNPLIGVAGTAVSISGTNFDSIPGNDDLSFNVARTNPSSATSTSLTAAVPSTATSGHIAVRTSAGKGISSGYFFVPPPPYTVSSVQYTGQIALGGQTNVSISTASKIGLLVFEGTQGKAVSLTTSGGTFGSCNLAISILTPNGATLGASSCMGSSGLLGSFTMPMTGTYTILFVPSGSSTGAVTVNVYDASDITGTIAPGGAPVTSTVTVPGQKVRLSFTGSYLQIISSEITGLG